MDNFLKLLSVLATILSIAMAGDIFSSMASLRKLKREEQDLVDITEDYIEREYQRLAELKRTLEEARLSLRTQPTIESNNYVELDHPITSYALVRNWATIARKALQKDDVMDFHARARFPDQGDHRGAVRALLRLQAVYNISTEDMLRGNIRGHHSPQLLHSNDYFDIGVEAMSYDMNQAAVEWLKLSVQHPPTHVPMQEVYYKIAEAYYYYYRISTRKIHDLQKAVEHSLKATSFDPANYTLTSRKDFYIQQYQSNLNRIQPPPTPLPDWKINYQKLCRGEEMEGGPRWYHADVWCQYSGGIVPYAPYKQEILHRDPFISIFYDVISDFESDMLKERARPQLLRAAVGDPAQAYASDERVSKVAWLWDNMDEGGQVTQLSHRIQDATGLSTRYALEFSDSEPFQVVNYGMGGQYEPHVDVYEDLKHLANVPDFIKGTGDRVATFMFYLSDVKEGGATVFPLVKVYVPPVKNAAAFWYNIHRNGDLDLRTQHAGCPVLVGEKWVANKWIREGGQILRRPCGITRNHTETEAPCKQTTCPKPST